jgi:hypothetical protein
MKRTILPLALSALVLVQAVATEGKGRASFTMTFSGSSWRGR